jgi:hypothetical protein
MGIQVLTWDKNKNAAVLNVIPPLFPLLTFVYICGLKQYKNKFILALSVPDEGYP